LPRGQKDDENDLLNSFQAVYPEVGFGLKLLNRLIERCQKSRIRVLVYALIRWILRDFVARLGQCPCGRYEV
jgi:hypothetical protein